MTVEPLEPTIGAEVHDVDLRAPLDAETVAALRAALLDRKVLAFRAQHLSPGELEAFTRHLGEPFRRDDGYTGPKTYAGNSFVGTVGPTPPGRRPATWHMGGTWQERPLAFELLTMVVVPAVGGATLFADLQAAFDGLSAPMQGMLTQIRAAHSRQVTPTGRGFDCADVFDPTDVVDHPLVVVHPETGRRGLYLTSRITHLVGIPKDEGSALLAFLRSHAVKADYQYRHRWTAGDLVVWDNRSVWHRAVDDYGDVERWGYKTAVIGDWRPA
jgi:taurine dioxygenase